MNDARVGHHSESPTQHGPSSDRRARPGLKTDCCLAHRARASGSFWRRQRRQRRHHSKPCVLFILSITVSRPPRFSSQGPSFVDKAPASTDLPDGAPTTEPPATV